MQTGKLTKIGIKEPTPLAQSSTVLGIKIDLIDYARTIASIDHWRRNGEHHYVVIHNSHSSMLCRRDPLMRQATEGAALVLPDGVGIILGVRLLRYEHCGRVTGPTLMLKLCDDGRQAGYRHFFYGGREGVAEEMASNLTQRFSGLTVAGTYAPPFRTLTPEEDAQVVERINGSRPDIVWVGLGAPKQEKWMAAHLGRIEATAMIGVGAAFDFHSGHAKWAPRWVRDLGLEWIWRLAQEPRRMWRRNLDNPLFLLAVINQRCETFWFNERD